VQEKVWQMKLIAHLQTPGCKKNTGSHSPFSENSSSSLWLLLHFSLQDYDKESYALLATRFALIPVK